MKGRAPTPDEFPAFFAAIHDDKTPFDWQQRLLDRITATDPSWPDALALPTASGKTACIDIALFALACQADLSPRDRTAPRRIFFVVDRRVIVDEAFLRSRGIARQLREAKGNGILGRVANALRKIGGLEAGDDPVACYMLQGGIYRDHAWARSSTQPTVVCSTVDQVGSRLLFRGYGVSDSMRPIHAALVANDSLILLDEAHCAVPFMETVNAVRDYRRRGEVPGRPQPFHFVILSATPPPDCANHSLGLSQADRENPVLGLRLTASKPVDLVVGPASKDLGKTARTLVEHASRHADALEPNAAVAILVNRVGLARAVFQRANEHWKNNGADVVLLTGRMRTLDRKAVVDRLSSLGLKSGTPRTRSRPVIVVATQCLEVGADLDFDAIVTECASLDALRQRFGRLNRLGLRPSARGTIVMPSDRVLDDAAVEGVDPSKLDPIYGAALPRTWNWLQGVSQPGEGGDETKNDRQIDFGIDAFDRLRPPPDKRQAWLDLLQQRSLQAPTLLPAHLDAWVQTAPMPAPDPEPALFLHGPGPDRPEIQVCWRADLNIDFEKRWVDAVSLLPPKSAECVRVPLPDFRRWWLDPSGKSADTNSSDLEQQAAVSPPPSPEESPFPILRWAGPESERTTILDDPQAVRPGDLIVIPAGRGGLDALSTVGDSSAAERLDVAEQTHVRVRRRALLRLHPAIFKSWEGVLSEERRKALIELVRRDEIPDAAELRPELEALAEELKAQPSQWQTLIWIIDALIKDGRFKIRPHPDHPVFSTEVSDPETRQKSWPGGLLLTGSRLLEADPDLSGEEDIGSTEDDIASAGTSVTLDEHTEGVAKRVGALASLLGMDDSLQCALIHSALWHDLGKADPRFQAWLRGGHRLAVLLSPRLLAKSGTMPTAYRERDESRRRAGYPKGGRHELVSVRLAERLLHAGGASEVTGSNHDLLLHLIAAHHGHARPLAPVVRDGSPVIVPWVDANGHTIETSSDTQLQRLDSGVPDRFWNLVRRHGWWGLAFLEAQLRIADQNQSESEQIRSDVRESKPCESETPR